MVDALTTVFGQHPTCDVKNVFWILCFSKSEEAALSSLSWSVFCVSGFVTLFLKSTASFTLALSLFGLLYTETWQV